MVYPGGLSLAGYDSLPHMYLKENYFFWWLVDVSKYKKLSFKIGRCNSYTRFLIGRFPLYSLWNWGWRGVDELVELAGVRSYAD
jgi:hypothetical protein